MKTNDTNQKDQLECVINTTFQLLLLFFFIILEIFVSVLTSRAFEWGLQRSGPFDQDQMQRGLLEHAWHVCNCKHSTPVCASHCSRSVIAFVGGEFALSRHISCEQLFPHHTQLYEVCTHAAQSVNNLHSSLWEVIPRGGVSSRHLI